MPPGIVNGLMSGKRSPLPDNRPGRHQTAWPLSLPRRIADPVRTLGRRGAVFAVLPPLGFEHLIRERWRGGRARRTRSWGADGSALLQMPLEVCQIALCAGSAGRGGAGQLGRDKSPSPARRRCRGLDREGGRRNERRHSQQS
jgi:hypothetical protein